MRATGTSAGMCYFLLVWMGARCLGRALPPGCLLLGQVFRPHLELVEGVSLERLMDLRYYNKKMKQVFCYINFRKNGIISLRNNHEENSNTNFVSICLLI